jgi:hypothetical protein
MNLFFSGRGGILERLAHRQSLVLGRTCQKEFSKAGVLLPDVSVDGERFGTKLLGPLMIRSVCA